MRVKKVYRQILIGILFINLAAIGLFSYEKLCRNIPDELRITVNEEKSVKLPIKMGGILGEMKGVQQKQESVGVLTVNNKKLDQNVIRIQLNESFSLKSPSTGTYKMNVYLFGILPIKTVNVDVVEERYITPGGFPIGITIKTDGLLVLGTGIIGGHDGLNYEPALNIVKTGDYILAVNNEKISTKEDFIKKVQHSGGNSIELTLNRHEEEIKVKIQPLKTAEGEYKAGIWIREDTQGIGTLTYIDEDGNIGALGHGITDTDTGILMNVLEGALYKANILKVVKGKAGTPGELVGTISKKEDTRYGSIIKNTDQGIFGTWEKETLLEEIETETLLVGYKQEVHKGTAWIRCEVDKQIGTYEIEIEEIELNSNNDSKGMVIHVVDEELLSKTNGIIQGMSGSPIIQDGKIIGAVTHVFVQDSTRGYGIFIENMLKAAK